MKQDLTAIIDLLGQILDVQESLLAISEEKRECLVKSQPEKLAGISNREMELLGRINHLEKQRIRGLGDVAVSLGKMPRAVAMADLIGCAAEGQAQALEKLQGDIMSAVRAQNAINKLNKILLEAHMDYTEIMLGAFVGPDDNMNQYYDRAGNADLDGAANPGLFDTQA